MSLQRQAVMCALQGRQAAAGREHPRGSSREGWAAEGRPPALDLEGKPHGVSLYMTGGSSSGAAIPKYHRLNRKASAQGSGGQTCEIKVSAVVARPSEECEGASVPCLSPSFQLAGSLWFLSL